MLATSSSYLAFASKDDRAYELLASNPDIELSSQVRDLFDSYQFKNVFYRFLPGIHMTKLIRVPKLVQPLKLDTITSADFAKKYGFMLSKLSGV